MTIGEKKQLLELDFKKLWKNLWGDMVGLQYRGEERGAYDKFTQIKRGIQLTGDSSYNLESLINESNSIGMPVGISKGSKKLSGK